MSNLTADVIGDVALIIGVSWLAGVVARRCGQPTVVGQILVGIMLGPNLVGHLTGCLFPDAALPYLSVISQVAVTIFMFAVGYEMDWRSSRRLYRPTLLVAVGAMLIPLGLGSGTAVVLRSSFQSLGQSGTGYSFTLFMGVAVSITALPVLAALIRERGIAGTVAGLTATSAAGLMDVAAWLLLAAALMDTTQKPSRPWPVTCALLIAFAVFLLFVVRPLLGRWTGRSNAVLASQLPVALVLALGSAWVTASLGLHAVFGGLLAGFAMPRRDGVPDPDVLRPIEEIGSVLLPLFFVVTGLPVNVGSLNGTAFVLLAALCVIASLGKTGPAYAASRLGGLGRKDAATVAALVNTRGLTELIALDVGLTAGLISQRLFDVLVLMAVLTTMMTAPLLRWISPATAASPGSVTAGPADRDSAAQAL
jgi:Kef-type K+ transport system membrane component KefB